MARPRDRPLRNRIISWRKIREFLDGHPEDPSAFAAFSQWYDLARAVPFADFHEVRRVFAAASLVGELVVFNVGGNKYRLVARILYEKRRIYIRRVLTHRDYDRGDWRE